MTIETLALARIEGKQKYKITCLHQNRLTSWAITRREKPKTHPLRFITPVDEVAAPEQEG